MPELPEVETIRRVLERDLPGRRISRVRVLDRDILSHSPMKDLSVLKGRKILALSRLGKLLWLELDGLHLAFHLRMSGCFFWGRATTGCLTPSCCRLEVSFSGGRVLHFVDIRRLGKAYLLRESPERFFKLGADALSPDFRPESLCKNFSRFKAPIKTVLLSQKAAAGLGNIYATEALFRAKINPFQPARDLSLSQVRRLCLAVREVLEMGIRYGGCSIRNYRDPLGRSGSAQKHLKVYGRKSGQPCPDCGRKLETVRIAQRSCVFCPNCQKITVSDTVIFAGKSGLRAGSFAGIGHA